jgi:hypothetical protein
VKVSATVASRCTSIAFCCALIAVPATATKRLLVVPKSHCRRDPIFAKQKTIHVE